MGTSNSVQQLIFPCNYLLKIIGLANDEFETVVLPILNKHIPNLPEGAITYNKSRSDKYMALTINFYAASKEQVDELYRELTSKPEVLMAL
jgi:putative lipoic acid-binding regulatory protein